MHPDDTQFLDDLKAYLRVSRCGGMPAQLAQQVEETAAHFLVTRRGDAEIAADRIAKIDPVAMLSLDAVFKLNWLAYFPFSQVSKNHRVVKWTSETKKYLEAQNPYVTAIGPDRWHGLLIPKDVVFLKEAVLIEKDNPKEAAFVAEVVAWCDAVLAQTAPLVGSRNLMMEP